MLIHPYTVEELNFAYCYRVYFRSRTHRRKPNADLPRLSAETLGTLLQPYNLQLLELATDSIDVRALQPSAYVGSFGDLNSNAIGAYIRRWEEDADE